MQLKQIQLDESIFRMVQERSPDPFGILEAVRDEAGAIVDFKVKYANPASGRLMRHTPEEMVERRLLELFPLQKAELFGRYVEVLETGVGLEIDTHYDGEGIVGWFHLIAIKLDDGIAVYVKDISEQKVAEVALRKSEGNLARAQAIAHVGNWSWEIETDTLLWSEEMFRIYGIDPKTFDGKAATVAKRIGGVAGDGGEGGAGGGFEGAVEGGGKEMHDFVRGRS